MKFFLKYIIFIILWCFLCNTTLFAGTIMFENANQLYRSKQYKEASNLYLQIINDGYGSNSVYYNAGNTFFKLQKMGYAVWCYQKALQYDASNKATLENLTLAKKKLASNNSNEFWVFKKVHEILNYFTLNQWASYTWVIFILVVFLFILKYYNFSNIAFSFFRKLTLFAFCIFFLCTAINYFFNKFNKLAIVVENCVAYKSPTDKEGLGTNNILEGMQVIIKDSGNIDSNYTRKVKLPNGSICWLKANCIREL